MSVLVWMILGNLGTEIDMRQKYGELLGSRFLDPLFKYAVMLSPNLSSNRNGIVRPSNFFELPPNNSVQPSTFPCFNQNARLPFMPLLNPAL